MKTSFVGVLVLSEVLLALGMAPAQGAAGGTTLSSLSLDPGALQMGRGGVGVAMEGDIHNMAYNPAWLADLRKHELALSHVQWMKGIQYQEILYGLPFRFGGVGARFQHLSYGRIAGYGDGGLPGGDFSAGDNLFSLGAGAGLWENRILLGASLKLARERIGDASVSASILETGALLRPWQAGVLEGLTFGLAVRNLGSSVSFDSAREKLPMSVDLGVGMDLLERRLRLGADIHLPRTQSAYANAGLELRLHPQLSWRAGFETGREKDSGLRTGLGFNLANVQVNYAFVPMGDLGMTHHLGVVFQWGGNDKPLRAKQAIPMRGNRYVLDEKISFESGSAELSLRAQQVLTRIASEIRHRRGHVVVEGHTDNMQVIPGSSYASNYQLSMLRAGEVVRFLESRGISSTNISAMGYGPRYPVASNHTEEGREKNRRIEIYIRESRDTSQRQSEWLGGNGSR